jgi:hypothetical protein
MKSFSALVATLISGMFSPEPTDYAPAGRVGPKPVSGAGAKRARARLAQKAERIHTEDQERRKLGHRPAYTRQQDRAQLRLELKRSNTTDAERGRRVMDEKHKTKGNRGLLPTAGRGGPIWINEAG